MNPHLLPLEATLTLHFETAFHLGTGRAEGLSISFESHLLGSAIEYDEARLGYGVTVFEEAAEAGGMG